MSRYRRLVPSGVRALLRSQGLPRLNWYIGSAEGSLHEFHEARARLRCSGRDRQGHGCPESPPTTGARSPRGDRMMTALMVVLIAFAAWFAVGFVACLILGPLLRAGRTLPAQRAVCRPARVARPGRR